MTARYVCGRQKERPADAQKPSQERARAQTAVLTESLESEAGELEREGESAGIGTGGELSWSSSSLGETESDGHTSHLRAVQGTKARHVHQGSRSVLDGQRGTLAAAARPPTPHTCARAAGESAGRRGCEFAHRRIRRLNMGRDGSRETESLKASAWPVSQASDTDTNAAICMLPASRTACWC